MTKSGNGTGWRSLFSRRAFLRGSGAAAAATALQAQVAAAADDAAPRVIRGATTVTLNVNGQQHPVTIEPRDTLLEVLRYQLDLTGAKPVSTDGTSGACLVLIDGKPAAASDTLAIACQGKAIETVENRGIDNPDAVVRAFVEHDATQCGFCTPGFVVAVRAFLARHPQATEDEIRAGLNGNICRCGTYANVVKAVLAAAKGGGNG
ncbi:MAG: (2Fe-2S)-binding protein [Planctomycetes bacterium]|nr:(2Fe-2S)-binding protein [Planctomycetota bacterium]